MSRIQARVTKKLWQDWARANLQSKEQAAIVDTAEVLQQLPSQARPSLSYEVEEATFAQAASAISAALEEFGIVLNLAIVGDHIDPAVLHLQQGDLEPLLLETAAQDLPVVLVVDNMNGEMTVDMPTLAPTADFLISARGSAERLIEAIHRRLPGGTVFRGN